MFAIACRLAGLVERCPGRACRQGTQGGNDKKTPRLAQAPLKTWIHYNRIASFRNVHAARRKHGRHARPRFQTRPYG
jgi:hypothetical protein